MTGIRLHFRTHEISRDGVRVYLPPKIWRVGATVVVASGCPLTADDLIEAVYGDDPRGGPLYAYEAIGKWVYDLRRILQPIGVAIPNEHGLGWFFELMPWPVALAA